MLLFLFLLYLAHCTGFLPTSVLRCGHCFYARCPHAACPRIRNERNIVAVVVVVGVGVTVIVVLVLLLMLLLVLVALLMLMLML